MVQCIHSPQTTTRAKLLLPQKAQSLSTGALQNEPDLLSKARPIVVIQMAHLWYFVCLQIK